MSSLDIFDQFCGLKSTSEFDTLILTLNVNFDSVNTYSRCKYWQVWHTNVKYAKGGLLWDMTFKYMQAWSQIYKLDESRLYKC